VLVATLADAAYPPAAQEVFRVLGPGTDVYALYGYEAMSVILDAINRGGPTRAATVRAFFETRDRDSVIGRYSILPSGDTNDATYGVYRINGRRELEYKTSVEAPPPR
jgi:branched-chain amino acid transport system substrate-binding protein